MTHVVYEIRLVTIIWYRREKSRELHIILNILLRFKRLSVVWKHTIRLVLWIKILHGWRCLSFPQIILPAASTTSIKIFPIHPPNSGIHEKSYPSCFIHKYSIGNYLNVNSSSLSRQQENQLLATEMDFLRRTVKKLESTNIKNLKFKKKWMFNTT